MDISTEAEHAAAVTVAAKRFHFILIPPFDHHDPKMKLVGTVGLPGIKPGSGRKIIHPEGDGRMILLHVRSCLHKLI